MGWAFAGFSLHFIGGTEVEFSNRCWQDLGHVIHVMKSGILQCSISSATLRKSRIWLCRVLCVRRVSYAVAHKGHRRGVEVCSMAASTILFCQLCAISVWQFMFWCYRIFASGGLFWGGLTARKTHRSLTETVEYFKLSAWDSWVRGWQFFGNLAQWAAASKFQAEFTILIFLWTYQAPMEDQFGSMPGENEDCRI